jgi:creatinine amidohydrolase
MARYLAEMTVNEVRDTLKTLRTVIIPVGVVEQHGYHLPLCVDIHNCQEVALRAGDRLNAIVAPTVPYCYSGGELPGTINISPSVFSLYLGDICTELVRMGFEKIVVLLGHAGTDNRVALKSTLQMFLKRNAAPNVSISLVEVWNLSPTWLSYFKMEPEHDFHAGEVETSLMLYWHPEQVRPRIVMDDPETSRMMRSDQDWFEISEKAIDHPFVVPHVYQRKEIEVGVMGFPERADRALGEKVCSEMVEGLVEFIDFINAR